MGKEHQDTSKKAAHWLELKTAWKTWQAGEPMPALSPEAQAYFENLAFRHLRQALDACGRRYERVPRPADPAEAWRIVFTYLVEKRPVASVLLLDDIFERAEWRARAHTGDTSSWDTLEEFIGWIQKQFAMRLRDVARAYARDLGTNDELDVTSSGDAPIKTASGGSGKETPSVFQMMPADGDAWGTEVERREIEKLGSDVGAAHFAGLRPAAKLGVFLKSMRDCRGIIISSEKDEVAGDAGVSGVKKSVFSSESKAAHANLVPRLVALSDWPDLDVDAQRALGIATIRSLWSVAEDWLWSGAWLDDLPAEHKSLPADRFADLARDFATMLRGRMMEFFPEKQMAAFFNHIEARLNLPASTTPTIS